MYSHKKLFDILTWTLHRLLLLLQLPPTVGSDVLTQQQLATQEVKRGGNGLVRDEWGWMGMDE